MTNCSIKKYPTFDEYVNSIKEFYTHRSPFIYFSIIKLSDSKIQLQKLFFYTRNPNSFKNKSILKEKKCLRLIMTPTKSYKNELYICCDTIDNNFIEYKNNLDKHEG